MLQHRAWNKSFLLHQLKYDSINVSLYDSKHEYVDEIFSRLYYQNKILSSKTCHSHLLICGCHENLYPFGGEKNFWSVEEWHGNVKQQ